MNIEREHMLDVTEDFFGYNLTHARSFTREEINKAIGFGGYTFALLNWNEDTEHYELFVPISQKKEKSFRQMALEYFRQHKRTRDPFR